MSLIFEYKGYQIEITENVYFPSDDSYLLIDNLKVEPDCSVLEIGTGCGLIALIASKTAKRVLAIDVSPVAVQCARKNVKLNYQDDKIEIRQGNLFSSVKTEEKFDIILFNPPYLPENGKVNTSWLEKAWDGGKTGRKFIDPFIKNCKLHLRECGRVQMVQSSLSGISESIDMFQNQGFQVEIGTKKSFFFESIVIIDASLKIS